MKINLTSKLDKKLELDFSITRLVKF